VATSHFCAENCFSTICNRFKCMTPHDYHFSCVANSEDDVQKQVELYKAKVLEILCNIL
jgi:hypothetical protein